jgi:hypothetical protein
MMHQSMYKQMIDLQKNTFDNSFNVMMKMQEQGEAMLNVFMSQAPWMPEEGKQALKEWASASAKARDDFKKVVDENFKKVEDFSENFPSSAK